jgi:hypothetical protein
MFPDVGALLSHLRLCRDASSTDRILRTLLAAKITFNDGNVERILILAFLPHMHAALRSVTRRHPQLSADDASQSILQSLLRFLESHELQARQNFLGFAIARRIKRSAFEWADQERRLLAVSSDFDGLEMDGPHSFERLVELRHFLDRAVRRGILDGGELHLLIQFKLQNGSNDDLPQENAHRQRLKRLLAKLRRLAAGRKATRKRLR